MRIYEGKSSDKLKPTNHMAITGSPISGCTCCHHNIYNIQVAGIVQNMDWTGLDSWTGQLDWTVELDNWTGQLDWTAGLDSWTGLLDWDSFPLNRRNNVFFENRGLIVASDRLAKM